MKPKDLKVGKIYVHFFSKDDYHIMILLDKNSEELTFATYSSEKNAWYIPDIWNYDFENDGFDDFDSDDFSSLEKQDFISSIFREVL